MEGGPGPAGGGGNKRGQRNWNSSWKTPVKKMKIKEEPLDEVDVEFDEDEILLPRGTWRRPSDEPKKNLTTLDGLRYLLQHCMVVQTKSKGQTVVIIRGDEDEEEGRGRNDKDKKDRGSGGGCKGDENGEGYVRGMKMKRDGGDFEKKLFTKSAADRDLDRDAHPTSEPEAVKKEETSDPSVEVEVVTLSDSPVKDPEGEGDDSGEGSVSKISKDAALTSVSKSTFAPVRLSSVALACMRSSENPSSGSQTQIPVIRQSVPPVKLLEKAPKNRVGASATSGNSRGRVRRRKKMKSGRRGTGKVYAKGEIDVEQVPDHPEPDWLALKQCRIILIRCDEEILDKGAAVSKSEGTSGTKKRKGRSEGLKLDMAKKVRELEADSKSVMNPTIESSNLDEASTYPAPWLLRSESHPVLDGQQKGYQCDICFRALRSESHLSSHMLSHTTTTTGRVRGKVWKCEVCEKDFVFESYLNVHLRRSVKHKEKLKMHKCSGK